jgi:4-diphosphocytidyl-2-C-methyl-D-erythritol kinase
MPVSSRIRLRAHAKINLDLRILGKRADGYHELRTIFQTIALHDLVIIESRRGTCDVDGDASLMPLDETNLAWRAAVALWRAAGRRGSPSGARIAIDKRIPSQAGLGGGSSDAAASLVGLNRVWQLGLSRARLMAIGATLGADVPFFLTGGTALGLGRGDEIYALQDLPARPVVIAWAGEGVSSADAYGWFTAATDRRSPTSGPCSLASLAEGDMSGLSNDLEGPVEARRPMIRRLRRELASAGAMASRMSGSGSAVFALFAKVPAARRAAAAISGPDRRVLVTRTVGRLAGGHRVG